MNKKTYPTRAMRPAIVFMKDNRNFLASATVHKGILIALKIGGEIYSDFRQLREDMGIERVVQDRKTIWRGDPFVQ